MAELEAYQTPLPHKFIRSNFGFKQRRLEIQGVGSVRARWQERQTHY